MEWVVVFGALLGSALIIEATKCDTYVDITDGIRDGTSIIKDGITYIPDNYFEVDETIQGCICNIKPCVRRCCSKGQAMNLTSRRCESSIDQGLLPGFSVFSIINVPENKICTDIQVKIKTDEDIQVVDGVLIWSEIKFSMNDFCLAVTSTNKTYAIACVVNDEVKVDRAIACLGNSCYLFPIT